MDLGLDGRVAVVTAASKGLGRASALALAAEGARVVVSARTPTLLDELVAQVEAGGGQALAVPGDVTDPALAQRLVDAALARWGRLDVVVGNAGGPPTGRALDVDDAALLAAFDVNALASIRLARAAVPHLVEQGWGRICFIASASVKQPIRDLALSNTARAALWAWTKTAAADLAGHGVTANLACPGLHTTDRLLERGVPAGARAGTPEDFGKVVAFLCSAPAAFVNGSAVGVDGGAVLGLL